MSPYRLVLRQEGITTTVSSDNETPFPLKPQELANLVGLRSKTNLYPREKELGVVPDRKKGRYGTRLYSDRDIIALASSFGCEVNTAGDDTVIIGRTGNMAFIRNKP
jgi:hypothetical protein